MCIYEKKKKKKKLTIPPFLSLPPRLWLMYWLNYLDRNAIALARLSSLEIDTNLTGSQYQTCVSILFVGYILGQVPSNMLITRLRPSYYMSACMFLWAVVSGLTALSKNFVGLFLTRFFLGVVEAPYYPGALYILGIFYTRKELATRISILYTGNILATAFAGLIAIGIFRLEGYVFFFSFFLSFFLMLLLTLSLFQICKPSSMAMALHHPRRSNRPRRPRSSLHPPGRPPRNPLAHTRRASSRQQPRARRPSRSPTQRLSMERFKNGSFGSQIVAICFHATHAFGRKRIQKFLPDCRGDVGV